MISEFLQFGYLGFLALMIFLCYRIIEGGSNSGRTFRETLVILLFFTLISLIGGSTGYLWASKELEVAKAKESTASILKHQIIAEREAHIRAMQPLQEALDSVARKLNGSVLNSTRREHLDELSQLNQVIQNREEQLSTKIGALNDAFKQVTR